MKEEQSIACWKIETPVRSLGIGRYNGGWANKRW
jgi:hypothetical protein